MRGVSDDTLRGPVRSRAPRMQRACLWLGLGLACAGVSELFAADRNPFQVTEPAEVVDAPFLRPKAPQASQYREEPLTKVRIEGNTTIAP